MKIELLIEESVKGSENQLNRIEIRDLSAAEQTVKELQVRGLVVDRHENPQQWNEFVQKLRQLFLPFTIVELDGYSEVKLEELAGHAGLIRVYAPQDESSIAKGFQLADAYRKQMHQGFLRKYADLRAGIMEAYLQALKIKDLPTYQHTLRLEILAEEFVEYLGLDQSQAAILRAAALMHDVGKIGILDTVLNKPSRLTGPEYEIIKTHVVLSCQLLEQFPDLQVIIPTVRHHHERFDGTGYPDQLRGRSIPYLARILTILDNFDSLTSARIYKGKRFLSEALRMMKEASGHFDPELLNSFQEFIMQSETVAILFKTS